MFPGRKIVMNFDDIELDAQYSLNEQCLKAVEKSLLKQDFEAISTNLAETILSYSGIPVKFHQELKGRFVTAINSCAEPTAESTRGSAILNISMVKGSGVYTWKLQCLENGSGCRYIGVIDGTGLDKDNLNYNLQNGCQGRRIAWDGGCAKVYEDMDQYMSTRIGGRCQKDYELEIKADMNTCIVTFSFPDGTEHHATIPRKMQTRFFYPVIGFGRSPHMLEKWKLLSFKHEV